jgi:hypothetical protein
MMHTYSIYYKLKASSLYMFQALLVHLQEVLHQGHLVYCVRVMSVGCTRIGMGLVPEHVEVGDYYKYVNLVCWRKIPYYQNNSLSQL